MAAGKKILKFFLWLVIIVIITVVSIGAWLYFSESEKRDPFSVIPEDAIFIIETNNLTEGWTKLSDSKMWKHLMGNKSFEDINADASSLDSLIKGNETLGTLFNDRKLLISAHMISSDDYDFIFAVDLKQASKITFLKDYISGIVADFGYTMSDRDFNGTEISLLTDIETGEVLNLAFIDNIMTCSYSSLLIEKAVLQKDTNYWGENQKFRFVAGDIDDDFLFNIYFNYNLIDEYLRCFISEPGESVCSLSEILTHSAFNLNFDDELLSLKGYTATDTISSYINALLKVSPGEIKAYNIISERAAFYLAICFNDFNEFYESLRTQFNAEDTSRAENYELTVRKTEKYLKIDLQEDFFDWIGNEITFVKLEPTSNAREEDVVVTIHSKDIEAAKKGLDRITSQIKKRTFGLTKFNDFEYKDYTIKYLNFSGFLKLFFGKLFSNIEKPYFTFIEDFVVFSNSPSCLMDVIDDYSMSKTLSNNEKFMKFLDNFDKTSNVSVFIQMPRVYSHMYYYSKGDKRKGIKENKDIILGFTRIGFQLISDDGKFKTSLIADFDEDAAFNDELERIEAAAEELFVGEIDTGSLRIIFSDLDMTTDGPAKINYDDTTALHYEGRILNGEPDGVWRIFYKSGKPAAAINFEDGKVNGVALYYYDNDKQSTMAEVQFKDDLIDGFYREFYENGERKAKVEYEEGVPNGSAEFYYDSGITKIEGQYKNGIKDGKWKHYTESGEIIDKEKWKKGRDKKKKNEE